MKLLHALVMCCVLAGSLAVPFAATPASAGTVVEKDPAGDGYSPCACHCIPWFGGRLCLCFCAYDPSQP
jgi:hypothetical protein